MSLLTVNLEQKLIAANRRSLAADKAALDHQTNLDAQIEKLRLGAEAAFREGKTQEVIDVAAKLGFKYKTENAARVKHRQETIAHLPQERVFTTAAIKRMCLTYGLRFLPTEHYKGHLDDALPAKVAEFEALDGGKTKPYSYHIAAPATSFHLTPRPKDPLLFARLTPDHWYLVHKWGDDLTVWARLKQMMPLVILLGIIGTVIGLGVAAFMLRNSSGPISQLCAFVSATIGILTASLYAAIWTEGRTTVSWGISCTTERNWDSAHTD